MEEKGDGGGPAKLRANPATAVSERRAASIQTFPPHTGARATGEEIPRPRLRSVAGGIEERGQSLRSAKRALVRSGPHLTLCGNYVTDNSSFRHTFAGAKARTHQARGIVGKCPIRQAESQMPLTQLAPPRKAPRPRVLSPAGA